MIVTFMVEILQKISIPSLAVGAGVGVLATLLIRGLVTPTVDESEYNRLLLERDQLKINVEETKREAQQVQTHRQNTEQKLTTLEANLPNISRFNRRMGMRMEKLAWLIKILENTYLPDSQNIWGVEPWSEILHYFQYILQIEPATLQGNSAGEKFINNVFTYIFDKIAELDVPTQGVRTYNVEDLRSRGRELLNTPFVYGGDSYTLREYFNKLRSENPDNQAREDANLTAEETRQRVPWMWNWTATNPDGSRREPYGDLGRGFRSLVMRPYMAIGLKRMLSEVARAGR